MRKKLIYSCAIMMISLVGFGSVYATGNKTTEIEIKMNEINSLQKNLTEKIALAVEKIDQLQQKARELEVEIRDQKDQFSIETYRKAVLNPRIDYNLKLIQLLLGYITRLDNKIVYYKNGQDTLNYFFQQAQDDFLMIKTLNNLEMDKLIAQINQVLKEYTAGASKPMLDANDVPLKDTKLIWQSIINTN